MYKPGGPGGPGSPGGPAGHGSHLRKEMYAKNEHLKMKDVYGGGVIISQVCSGGFPGIPGIPGAPGLPFCPFNPGGPGKKDDVYELHKCYSGRGIKKVR